MSQLEIRNYTANDLDTLHQLTVKSAEADRVDQRSTLENIPSIEELTESLEASDKSDVLVGVNENGDIVGYGQIRWWQEEDGALVYLHSGLIYPDKRREGHGAQLLEALESRIQEFAKTHDKNAPKVIGANSSETSNGKTTMLEKRGYGLVHSMVEMEFDDRGKLPDTTLPKGFILKTSATQEEKRKIYEANKRTYEGTFGISPSSEEDFEEFLEDNPDSSLWRVVWHGDELAGFVISRHRGDNSAEIMEVTVVPEFRRRGLAGYLMAESIRSLQAEGSEVIRLHTDAEGKMGGRQLYESVGFKALKEHQRYRKSVS